jgi:hypothetical protein
MRWHGCTHVLGTTLLLFPANRSSRIESLRGVSFLSGYKGTTLNMRNVMLFALRALASVRRVLESGLEQTVHFCLAIVKFFMIQMELTPLFPPREPLSILSGFLLSVHFEAVGHVSNS